MTRTPFPRLDAIARALLREASPRASRETMRFHGPSRPAKLEEPAERAAAALGSLLLWKLVRHGGCRLPVAPAARALEHLMGTFPETDRRRLEDEAVEILRWLEDSLNLLGDDWDGVEDRGTYPWEDREFPDEGKRELILRALQEGIDLEIEYFTYRRNCMSSRRITPLELEGDHVLRARCHWRGEERSFALHRIKEARPVQESSRPDARRSETPGLS